MTISRTPTNICSCKFLKNFRLYLGKLTLNLWNTVSTCHWMSSNIWRTHVYFAQVSKNELRVLFLSRRRPISYRNQSIDLQSKSMDWFYMILASVMKGLMKITQRINIVVLFLVLSVRINFIELCYSKVF